MVSTSYDFKRGTTVLGVLPNLVRDADKYRADLKRGILLFDSLIIPDLQSTVEHAERLRARSLSADLTYLADLRVLQSSDPLDYDAARRDEMAVLAEERLHHLRTHAASRRAMTLARMGGGPIEDWPLDLQYDFEDALSQQYESQGPDYRTNREHYVARALAAQLARTGRPIYSVFDAAGELEKSSLTRKETIVRVVLKHLDFPHDNSALPDLLEFRSKLESRQSLLAMRRWIRALAQQDPHENEVEEELEYLLNEHQAALRQQKLRARAASLETFLIVSADVLECLAKLKLRRLAEMGLQIFKARDNVLEQEQALAGREVSYLVKVRNLLR